MAIQVYCPNPVCANHTRPRAVPDELAGRQIGCKACGLVLTVAQPRNPASSWLMPLVSAVAAVLVIVAVAWVLLGIGGADVDENPQVAVLPDPVFDTSRDQRKQSPPA